MKGIEKGTEKLPENALNKLNPDKKLGIKCFSSRTEHV
jgi:hypothetical protein